MKNILKIKAVIYLFTIYLFTILISSCNLETIIDMELNDADNLPVLNCLFTASTPFKVELSKSIKVLEDNPTISYIQNAKVQLFANNQFIEELVYLPNNYYQSQYLAKTGENYLIKVEAFNYPTIEAYSTIPELPNNVQIYATDSSFIENSLAYKYHVILELNDNVNENNYYALSVIDTLDTNSEITYCFSTSDASIINSNKLNGDNFSEESDGNEEVFFCKEVLLSDKLFNGKNYKIEFNVDARTSNGENIKPIIKFSAIIKDYYNYQQSVIQQSLYGDNPFKEPVVVYSNIKGKGMGIFAGKICKYYSF